MALLTLQVLRRVVVKIPWGGGLYRPRFPGHPDAERLRSPTRPASRRRGKAGQVPSFKCFRRTSASADSGPLGESATKNFPADAADFAARNRTPAVVDRHCRDCYGARVPRGGSFPPRRRQYGGKRSVSASRRPGSIGVAMLRARPLPRRRRPHCHFTAWPFARAGQAPACHGTAGRQRTPTARDVSVGEHWHSVEVGGVVRRRPRDHRRRRPAGAAPHRRGRCHRRPAGPPTRRAGRGIA